MNKKSRLILILMLVMMVQAACTPSVATCPTSTLDTELLTNTEDGYCLLYPTKYSTTVPHYIVINPVTAPGDIPGDAWVSIDMEAAAGHTAAQVADAQISSIGSGFNITRTEAKVDDEQAVVVDGLPGPDPLRKVFIVHDDRLYTLIFMPWQPTAEGAEQHTPLEDLYTMIMQSLHFLPPADEP